MENEKIVRVVIHPGDKPSAEQIREVLEAAARPVVPDEDTLELTGEFLEAIRSSRRAPAGNART